MSGASVSPEHVLAAQGDLREFLRLARETGELVVVEDVDPHLEMGALFELSLERKQPPVLLFDRIKGFPPGYRVLMNIRAARIFNPGQGLEAVTHFRRRPSQAGPPPPIPPQQVDSGPVCQNVVLGDHVDLFAFPRPKWHALDGGEYIGTDCIVITKDPHSDWINVGTYRVQVQDRRTVSVFMEPGKHGTIIRQKYWDRGEACPMVVSVGQAPILAAMGAAGLPQGESELAAAGGRLGRPVRVVQGRITGLPIPADAELVFEGEMPAPDIESRPEGPFGEWPGYYASKARPEPVLRVQVVYHRDDPIITAAPPVKPTYPGLPASYARAAAIWDALEAAGVPGVRGVWMMQGGGARFLTVIAIQQEHAGHAKMAGLVAVGCGPGAFLGRLTVVVDEDIDITNPVEVLWAIATRWDPKSQTEIIDGCWTANVDPLLDPAKREAGDITNSRMIIYAVRPFHRRADFPTVNQVPASYAEQVRAKWAGKLAFLNHEV